MLMWTTDVWASVASDWSFSNRHVVPTRHPLPIRWEGEPGEEAPNGGGSPSCAASRARQARAASTTRLV
jgi:hypothetical protein